MSMRKNTYKRTGTDEWKTTVKIELDIADRTADEVLVALQQGIAAMLSEGVFGARMKVEGEGEGYDVEHWLVGQRSATRDEITLAEVRDADARAQRAARLRMELAQIERLENGS